MRERASASTRRSSATPRAGVPLPHRARPGGCGGARARRRSGQPVGEGRERALGHEDIPAAVVMFGAFPELSRTPTPAGASFSRSSKRSDASGRVGARAHAARRGDRIRAAHRRPPVGAPRDDRAPMAARSYTEPAGAVEEDRQVAETIIPELERLDDHLGMAKAWWLLSEPYVIEGRWSTRRRPGAGDLPRGRPLDEGQLHVLLVLYAQAPLLRPDTGARGRAQVLDLARRRPRDTDVRGGDRDHARGASVDGGPLRAGARAVRRLRRRLRGVRPALQARRPLDHRGADRMASGRPRRRRDGAAHGPLPCSRRWARAEPARRWPPCSQTSSRYRATMPRRSGSCASRERAPRRRMSGRRCSGVALWRGRPPEVGTRPGTSARARRRRARCADGCPRPVGRLARRARRCSATRARSAVAFVAMEEARRSTGKGNLAALQLFTPTSGPAP